MGVSVLSILLSKGGGVALLYASQELDKITTSNHDEKMGVDIKKNALKCLQLKLHASSTTSQSRSRSTLTILISCPFCGFTVMRVEHEAPAGCPIVLYECTNYKKLPYCEFSMLETKYEALLRAMGVPLIIDDVEQDRYMLEEADQEICVQTDGDGEPSTHFSVTTIDELSTRVSKIEGQLDAVVQDPSSNENSNFLFVVIIILLCVMVFLSLLR